MSYRDQLNRFKAQTARAGIDRVHGLRHHYAQARYAELTGWKAPAAGGASIVIEGGNITVMCPGKISVWAGKKSFVGAINEATQMPEMPRSTMKFDEKFQLVDGAGDPLKGFRVELIKPDGTKIQAVSDSNGMLPLQQGFGPEQLKIRVISRAT